MKQMKISIIIPVYNAEKTLKKCVDSCLCQSVADLEIILVDDGSVDKSAAICDEYAYKNSKIKSFHQKNSGVSVARNNGIGFSTGEYLAFVDSDDYVSPTMYERLLSAMGKTGADMVRCGFTVHRGEQVSKTSSHFPNMSYFDKKSIEMEILPRFVGNKKQWIIRDGISGLSSLSLYKRSIIVSNNIIFPVGIKNAEDLVFNVHYLMHVESMLFLDETLYHYVKNEISATASHMRDYFKDTLAAHKLICELTESVISNDEEADQFFLARLSKNAIINECSKANIRFSTYKYIRIVLQRKELWELFKSHKIPKDIGLFNRLFFTGMKYKAAVFLMLLCIVLYVKKWVR